MKEATGELSTTMIAIVAIAAVLTIFTVWLLPAMRSSIRARMYCTQAVNCSACQDGVQTCQYYDDDMQLVEDPITCDCETQEG
ncbi:MAG: hypothetical protein E7167_03340 [Firmicutes bacterium]|nr:hypothetical protein [Bacillota bacterium]